MKPIALITGASRGIGKAIAIRFAQEGYSLIINCSKSTDSLLALKTELEENYHIPVLASVGNVGDYTYVEQLFNERKDIYNAVKDGEVDNNSDLDSAVKGVIKSYENSCN